MLKIGEITVKVSTTLDLIEFTQIFLADKLRDLGDINLGGRVFDRFFIKINQICKRVRAKLASVEQIPETKAFFLPPSLVISEFDCHLPIDMENDFSDSRQSSGQDRLSETRSDYYDIVVLGQLGHL
jgi:hypothetical protein